MSIGNNICETRPTQEVVRGSENPRVVAYVIPPVNITETPEGYHLEAELPGVNRQGLEISLDGNELTLIGRRSPAPANTQLVYRESSQRDFRRVFELDPTIDTSKIAARLEDGLLKLVLPKAEKVKPRKIRLE